MQTGIELPTQFTAAGGPGAMGSERWWLEFGDPQLSAFVEHAALANPGVGQAVAQLRQADAQARIAAADRLPQVNVNFNAARQPLNLSGVAPTDDLAVGDLLPEGLIFNTFQLNAEVSWELDLWGRLSAQTAAARAEYLASSENLRAVRQSIAAEAARQYFVVAEAQAQQALAQRMAADVGRVARDLRHRADAGVALPVDRHLSDANDASVRANLHQRTEAASRARREFEVLLREYPSGTVRVAAELPELPAAPAAGVPAGVLARRPDVLAAELALRASGYQVDAARRSLLPALQITGSVGRTSNALDQLFDGNTTIWSIAGALLQPVFQGGRLRAQVRQSEGAHAEAIERYVEVALQALYEVEAALEADQLLLQQDQALKEAATAAEQAARVAVNRYRAGVEPFIAVLESQQQALDTQSAWLSGRRARLENRIALHLAIGGGFEGAVETDPTP